MEEKNAYPSFPDQKIEELYAKLKGYKVFSSIDLRSGYNHIGLWESAKPKSAFVLSSFGKYQFSRVPFGLAQAPAYFRKLINDVLKGCNGLQWVTWMTSSSTAGQKKNTWNIWRKYLAD